MYKINGRDIRQIVSREDWQQLRKSLLGTWKKTPKENVIRLRQFLKMDNDKDRRIIVLNYLTGSAFRIGIINHPQITKLKKELSK